MKAYIRLLRYMTAYWRRFVVAVICMAFVGALSTVPAFLMKQVVDDLFIAQNAWMLVFLPLVILVTYLARGIFLYGQTYLMYWIGQRVVMDVRNALYRHLHKLPLAFFERKATGELMSKLTYDITLMQKASSSAVRDVGRQGFTLIFLLGLAFHRDPLLAGVFILVLPPLGFLVARMGAKIRRITRQSQQRMGDMSAIMKEAFSGVRVVKAFNAEDYEIERFRRSNKRFFNLIMKAQRVRALSHPLVEALGGIGAALILWYGGTQVLNGLRTPGEFTSFLVAIGLIYSPIKSLTRVYHTLQEGMAASDEVFGLMDETTHLQRPAGGRTAPRLTRAITFEEVSFQYEDAPVLEDINLEIRAGEMVGLVGESGAGKTTFLDLLLGFYHPIRGRILWDGIDLRELDPISLRSQIGVVTQQTILFNESMAGNIAYNLLDVSPDRIEAAARAANAHGFISALPKGYDTVIGEDGALMSGGERQRVAIARTLLRDPPLLLLDEATSALDSKSEREIQEALNHRMEGRTSVVVAHRLSTLRSADRILVLHQGRLVEEGPHDSLMTQDGVYRKLYDLQRPDGPLQPAETGP
jgi:subfamily B ATP-binding cassette protein MsbA